MCTSRQMAGAAANSALRIKDVIHTIPRMTRLQPHPVSTYNHPSGGYSVDQPPSDADAKTDAARPPQIKGQKHASVEDINAEDQTFIEHVFESVKEVDFRGPTPPPPIGLSGLDKKMHTLRE